MPTMVSWRVPTSWRNLTLVPTVTKTGHGKKVPAPPIRTVIHTTQQIRVGVSQPTRAC